MAVKPTPPARDRRCQGNIGAGRLNHAAQPADRAREGHCPQDDAPHVHSGVARRLLAFADHRDLIALLGPPEIHKDGGGKKECDDPAEMDP